MRLLGLAGMIAAATISCYAGTDILSAFHCKYRGMKTVSFKFGAPGGMKGTFAARRGGMYRITTTDRTVVSDGSTVWNATTNTKSVVVSKYQSSSADVSIERVFFDVMNVYRSSIASNSGNEIVIRLEAPQPNVQISNITSVSITCTPTLAVKRVSVTSGGSTNDFIIANLVPNARISPTTFSYSIPHGWQSVDIR